MKAFDIILYVFAVIGGLSTLIAIGGFILFIVAGNQKKKEQIKTEKEFTDMFDIDLSKHRTAMTKEKKEDFRRMFNPFGEGEGK
jgi:hypothetical protein